MQNKTKIHYEARLKRNIKREPYNRTVVYKKGLVLWDCSEKLFAKLTKDNIHKWVDFCVCEGHGVYEYFDLEKDIQFFKVETTTKVTEKPVKLKK